MAKESVPGAAGDGCPNFGLVCLSSTDECRYRTITRSRYLALTDDEARRRALREIYWHNLNRLHWTLRFWIPMHVVSTALMLALTLVHVTQVVFFRVS